MAKKIFKITWENRYSQTIEADSKEEAQEMAMDLESNNDTYDERVYEDVEEI